MNTIRVSGNELWALFRRTFEALYTNRHDYNDLAQLVLWLELHQLAGVKLLAEALPLLENTRLPPTNLLLNEPTRCVMNAAGHSLLDVALSVIDFTIANTLLNEQCHISVQSCYQREVAIPFMARYNRRNLAAICWWHDAPDNKDHLVTLQQGDSFPAYYVTENLLAKSADHTLEIAGFLHDSQMHAWLEQQFPDIQHYLQSARPSVSPRQFAQRYQASLDSGIMIAQTDYKKLCAVADRVLIKSTDSSRLGAGE